MTWNVCAKGTTSGTSSPARRAYPSDCKQVRFLPHQPD
jgi:hypothetical protein